MEYSPAQIIVADLIHCEIGTDYRNGLKWSCYVDMQPDPDDKKLVPKEIISVYNQTGITDGRYQSDRNGEGRKTVEHPGIQVLVRSVNPIEGWRKTKEISNRFDEILRQEVIVDDDTDYVIQGIHRTTNPTSVGEDALLRLRIHSLNAILTYRLQENT